MLGHFKHVIYLQIQLANSNLQTKAVGQVGQMGLKGKVKIQEAAILTILSRLKMLAIFL